MLIVYPMEQISLLHTGKMILYDDLLKHFLVLVPMECTMD